MKPRLSLDRRLRELPSFDPPPGGWADLERRLGGAPRRRRLPLAAFAMAASLLVVVGLVAQLQPLAPPPVPATTVASATPADAELARLMAQSQRLERSLASLKPRVVVWDSRYAALTDDLQSDLAVVDLQLNYAGPEGARRLWQNRVALMSRLVQAHERAALAPVTPLASQEQSL